MAVSVATTDAPVVADRSVDGNQEYEAAPLAVSIRVFPPQTVEDVGVTVTVGFELTVITSDSLVCVVHPPPVTCLR